MTKHRRSMGPIEPIHAKFGLKGKFLIEVRHADGSSDHYKSDNMVVNSGLDYIGNGTGNAINGIAVGTGNSAPAAGQTTLDAGIAYVTSAPTLGLTFPSTVAPYVIQNSYVFTFAVGAVVGNIAEIAAIPTGSTATTGVIFSRSLIQVAGSPGTITLLSSDQLIVTYLLQTILTADLTGTIHSVIDGVSTAVNYTIKPTGMYSSSQSSYYGQKSGLTINNGGSFPGWYAGAGQTAAAGAVTSAPNPNGTNVVSWGNGGGSSLAAYTSGSHNRSATFTSPTAHPGPIGNATFVFNWFAFQLILASQVPFLTTQTLSWPVVVSWANAS